MKSRFSGIPVALAVAAGASILLAACGKDAQTGAPAAPPPPKVSVLTVAPQPVTLSTELAGRTAPYLVAEVRPPARRHREVAIEEGLRRIEVADGERDVVDADTDGLAVVVVDRDARMVRFGLELVPELNQGAECRARRDERRLGVPLLEAVDDAHAARFEPRDRRVEVGRLDREVVQSFAALRVSR